MARYLYLEGDCLILLSRVLLLLYTIHVGLRLRIDTAIARSVRVFSEVEVAMGTVFAQIKGIPP